jgi:hypothetical protein
MKNLLVIALAAVSVQTTTASAKTIGDDVVKHARAGDVASQYVLRADGSLFRQVGRNLCQVTSDVDDFKVAQHPNDPTAIYVVKKGGLFALTVGEGDRGAECPKAHLDSLISSLDRGGGKWLYKVVDRKDTPISLVAQDTSGRVTAWDQQGVAVFVEGAVTFKLNECFGSKKSFSSYVAFVLDGDGRVSKLGGKDPRKSKADPARYQSMDAFLAKNRVCK